MRIGQLAKAADVSCDTLRFYERLGLLQGRRENNGYRDYPPAAVEMVQFVKLAQELGFSLAEIREITTLLMQGGLPVEQVQAFVAEKIAVIDQRITTLQALRERLAGLALGNDCPLRRDCEADQPPQAIQLIRAEFS